LLRICRDPPEGIGQDKLLSRLSVLDKEHRFQIKHVAESINGLTQKCLLQTFRGTEVIWKPVPMDVVSKLTEMSIEERIVYQDIEREKDIGIWIKDLRKRTNITGNGVLEKILKTMQTRRLIKAEKSIAVRRSLARHHVLSCSLALVRQCVALFRWCFAAGSASLALRAL